MATEKLQFPAEGDKFLVPLEKSSSTKVEPKDFNIVWGENPEFWTLPTEEDPTATLRRVYFLEVSGKVTIPQEAAGRLDVGFEISKTDDHAGWKEANVLIGAKTGAMDKYLTRSIKHQVDYLEPNQKWWVGWNLASFDSSSDPNLQFAFLSTDEALEKKGMKFYGALVGYNA